MRFISSEFNDNTNELYYKSSIDQTVIPDGNYLYTKSNMINMKDGGVQYSYLNDTTREILLSSWYYDGTARTIAAFITNSGLPGTDNTSYSNTFDWNVKSAMQIRSGYFYTIISEDGLVFAKPQRTSASKQIGTFDVLSELYSHETDYSFEGEAAAKYTVSDEKETVTPISIDSAMKTARMNKYKSLQNVITFQSGYDANPLDYIFRSGKHYVVISRSLIKQDLYLYTAVLEVDDSYTFSGDDITPYIPQPESAADTWHYIGDAGEPAWNGAADNYLVGTYGKTGYKKIGNLVYVQGYFTASGLGLVWTFPTGYRPINPMQIFLPYYNSPGSDIPQYRFELLTDGTFTAAADGGATAWVANFFFPIDKN